ncbi:MAG TPA: type IV secretory system conjugative DNA transfer family protein [Solirubrobacterales bacterium]|nr:type IV secretory system conjugative DNA transfer family protein [Solirubrobacterales bacterium]
MTTSEQLYLGVAGGVAGLLALLWMIGGFAGVLFGGGWPAVGLADLGAVAARLPSHLGEPRDAWPADARSGLPGAAGIYATAVLIVGGLVGAISLARRAGVPLDAIRLGGRRRVPDARWATKRDLAPLRVPRPEAGRLTLGRFGRTLLAAEERKSVIVFAPTGTHKTSGLAIPALLEWEGPVLATSVKGDLLAETIERREALGEVMVFDPTGVSGVHPSHRATPLWGARTWPGAGKVAHRLCGAAQLGRSGLQDADFWFATAEKLLAPLLFAATSSRRTMADVVRWLDEGPQQCEAEVCKALRETEVPAALRAWQATQNREEKQRSSVYTTAETVVAAFADERVQKETEASDYTPERLLNGEKNTLYLCAPLHEQERLRPLFSSMVQELVAFAYELAALNGPLDPPLLLLLDEAANIAPMPNLDAIASTGAGQGIQLASIFQDMAQVATVYGGRAPTIVNNHAAKLIGIGISDPQTTSWVTQVTGATEVDQRSRSTGEHGRQSVTQGETYRDLAPANVVRERNSGSALLIYHNLPPAKINLRLWFEDKELQKLRSEGEQ